ncbi:Protein of unknown function [Pyronema omphalodes CBS 100304]|uniref:Uncharacterized protein n=1 Tax=Pyronema omphalodes (strain CBS 100304) TaxID=1076935 RepID=U4KWR3_PYROM|nr:Protein of unknown function [Pyronema omphalodes CBS 100304]
MRTHRTYLCPSRCLCSRTPRHGTHSRTRPRGHFLRPSPSSSRTRDLLVT